MSNEHRIEPVGGQFIVVDPWGEIVDRMDRYPSEKEPDGTSNTARKTQLRKRHTS
jgi:hypothetical protein